MDTQLRPKGKREVMKTNNLQEKLPQLQAKLDTCLKARIECASRGFLVEAHERRETVPWEQDLGCKGTPLASFGHGPRTAAGRSGQEPEATHMCI